MNKITKIHESDLKQTYISPENKYVKATIDIQAIKHNIDFLKNITGTELMPVIKADAYGHGLIEMSKILRTLGIKYLGVATLGEAIFLRKSGDNGRILGWLYNVEGQELIDAFNLDIDVAICDEKIIPIFTSLIPKNKKVKVTMFVDTGINRAGIIYEKAMQAFKDVAQCKNVDLVGMMSHLVCSGVENSPIIKEQLRKFRELRKNLEEIGIRPPLVHIANTGGCVNYDVSDFTISRPGRGIYGISANLKYDSRLKLIMTVTSQILQIKEIEEGSGIGYDWEYIAPQKMIICIIPIGYADIIPRNTSFKLNVYINGTKRKVLGRISMDQIVAESNNTDKINDAVFIFGNKENCPQTIYDVSDIGSTIPAEILTRIGDRVNKVYV
jgi:alanine racemase